MFLNPGVPAGNLNFKNHWVLWNLQEIQIRKSSRSSWGWLVLRKILGGGNSFFYFHPFLGKSSNLTIIFLKWVGSTTNWKKFQRCSNSLGRFLCCCGDDILPVCSKEYEMTNHPKIPWEFSRNSQTLEFLIGMIWLIGVYERWVYLLWFHWIFRCELNRFLYIYISIYLEP